MQDQSSINDFISRLAKKIAILYPNNCADAEDYIQAGHLKLIEISGNDKEKNNFIAYAIISISRAMRQTALGAMCAASAPDRVKKLVHKIELLFLHGMAEQEIQKELNIDSETLISLQTLSRSYSWYDIFAEVSHEQEPFSIIDDLLSSNYLNEEDRVFIRSQLNDNHDNDITKKQRWIQAKRIRHKLIRSGYGTFK